MNKLFIIVNVDTFFLSHRKEIALNAQKNGFDVTIIAGNTGKSNEIKLLGLKYINLPINKSGLNIIKELKTFLFLYYLFGKQKPNIVHLVGLKTILWGGLAAKLRKIHGLVSAISGLGIMFSAEYNKMFLSRAILKVLKFIHNRENTYCIFHNNEDLDFFVKNEIIDYNNCVRTYGSGIDLDNFKFIDEPNKEVIKILFTARMVEEKGVLVLAEAAKKLRTEYYNKVEFLLCGGIDNNPLAINESQLLEICDENYIQWLGNRNDVKFLLENCHIFAFPSYYKEGLPKSCIEAAAIGRPIITCDSIGCRDTVINGETGFIIPIKDSDALVDKLKILIDNKDIRKFMGQNARKFAEAKFNIEKVIEIHLTIYNKLAY